MNDKSDRELPSGIVKFTITRKKLKDILSDEYNENVKDLSIGEDGISISLQIPEEEEEEEEEGESGEEEEAEVEGESEEENQMF